MELKFIKNAEDRVWIAEFEATADIALHIEGVVEKDVEIYQRGTASGQYALVKDGTPAVSYGKVYDYEIPILIAPKFIKVVCRTEPTYAEVVSNGEITELKYQEKSVEVTANGNTEVIPDAGFAGLTKVNVSVNVPQSGGGESGSDWKYYDVSKVPSNLLASVLTTLCHVAKGRVNNILTINGGASGLVAAQSGELLGIGCCMSAYNYDSRSGAPLMTFKEYFAMDAGGMTIEQALIQQFGLVPITEEDFLNLNV